MVKIMRTTAWGVLVSIALGYVSLIPSVSQQLDAFEISAYGHALIVAVMLLFLVDALTLWLSAVSYAWQRGSEGFARWPAYVLIWANFPGALFYYFWFVRKHKEGPSGDQSE
jgi:hypothetical protein